MHVRLSNGGHRQSISVGLAFLLQFASASSTSADFLYFTDVRSPTADGGRIQRIRTDGTDLMRLAELGNGLRGIAINESTEELFWTNVNSDTIERVSFSHRQPQRIFRGGLEFPQDLAVDENTSRLVWIDASRNTIESVALDGSDRQMILDNAHGRAIAIRFLVHRLQTVH